MADSGTQQPDVAAILSGIRDTLTSSSFLGEPVVAGDVTLVPMYRVVGMLCQCHGCGTGALGKGKPGPETPDRDRDERGGAGARVRSKPIGAFAIRDGKVEWHPAMDMNRVILGGQLVGVVALLVAGALFRARRRRRSRCSS